MKDIKVYLDQYTLFWRGIEEEPDFPVCNLCEFVDNLLVTRACHSQDKDWGEDNVPVFVSTRARRMYDVMLIMKTNFSHLVAKYKIGS